MSNDNEEEGKLSLKVMVNKENNKVLFAEADADFADVLLSFLTLPLGKIVRLLNNHYGEKAPAVGSLTNLYNCLANLDVFNFWSEGGKQMLLDPASSFGAAEGSNPKIDVDDTKPATKYFKCGNANCGWKRRQPLIARYHDMLKCHCGRSIYKPVGMPPRPGIQGGGGGVFMKKGTLFLITDDLKMASVAPDSVMQSLFDLGVNITNGAQIRTVFFGLNEVMDLLRASLLSSTPLTDVVFNRKINKMNDVIRSRKMKEEEASSSSNSKKIILYALISKSDNSLYKLVSDGDFADFLVSLLTIPLGGVEWLLGGDTGFRSVDNLYRSIRNSVDEKCFRMSDTKVRLLKPKLPPGYLSRNQILSLEEEVNPMVCYLEHSSTGDKNKTEEITAWMHFKDPKGGESFVKNSAGFFIANDFTLRSVSDFIIREQRGLTTVKELKLLIGLEEAFDILRASLGTGLVFKDCVANIISKKLNNK